MRYSRFLLLVAAQVALAADNAIPACQDITAPGTYSLASNLVETEANTACLRIHDSQDVYVDCKFNAIKGGTGNPAPAISVSNVQRFSITHCTLQTENGPALTAINSDNGDIVDNTIGNLTDQLQFLVTFEFVNNTRLVHNTINAAFQQFYSSGNLLRLNTVTCPLWINNLGCSGVLVSVRGSNNTMESNQLDGRGSISTGHNGADDGIVIQDESGDILSNNTIRNTWDAGIETVGNITNMQIISNSITKAARAGIGGWYWISWSNVAVINNMVSDTGYLFYFFRAFGLRPQNWDGRGAPADTAVYFQGNLFSGNHFVDGSSSAWTPAYIPIYSYLANNNDVSGIVGERAAQASDFKLSSNTFTRNNFGHDAAPYFSGPFTPGVIIDGGANICSNPGAQYPLVCK